jgi:hypothetical protein
MSYQLINDHIESHLKKLKNGTDTKEHGKYSQYKSSLGLLFKLAVCTEKDFIIAITDNIEGTLKQCKSKLKEKGKSGTQISGPVSKIKKLSKLYALISGLNLNDLCFSDVLQEAIYRKFGKKNIANVEITPQTQREIKKTKITFREIAKDLIIDSKKENPNLWANVTINEEAVARSQGLGSASQILRNYFTGELAPSERISEYRILYIERWLDIPKNTLVKKLLRKNIETTREKRAKKRKTDLQINNKNEVMLSPDLKRIYDEYSAFKINGTDPVIRNIPKHELEDEYRDLFLVVQDMSSRTQKKWTLNQKNICGSQVGFHKLLIAFQSYCCEVAENGDVHSNFHKAYSDIKTYKDVSSYHLTHPTIIFDFARLATYVQPVDDKRLIPSVAGTTASRLCNFVAIGIKEMGYLYFCALKGERSEKKYFRDLWFLSSQLPILTQGAISAINERGKGHNKGKDKVNFLLDIDCPVERRTIVNKANSFAIQKGELFLKDSIRIHKAYKNESSLMKKEKFKHQSASCAKNGYVRLRAAMISELSFINSLRADNWTTLHYYKSVEEQDTGFPSITYHSKKNQFQLLYPLYGVNIVTDEEDFRSMKNSKSKTVQSIDIMFPEHITPLIKKYLKSRDLYLNNYVAMIMPETIETAKQEMKIIEDALIDNNHEIYNYKKYKSYDGEFLKSTFKDYIEELKLDISELSKFKVKDCKILMPNLSSRLSETKTVSTSDRTLWRMNRSVSRKLIMQPSKISGSYADMTREMFDHVLPDVLQEGYYIHANRHLSVCTYLDMYPNQIIQAAAIINDTQEQVRKTYGDRDIVRARKKLISQAKELIFQY